PEEYTSLGQFVDRVERRLAVIKSEAVREDEERVAAARADVPPAAFAVPLEQLGLREHVFNILTEAGFGQVGDLMVALRTDDKQILGLAGVGLRARQNIEEQLATLNRPEAARVVEESPAVAPDAEAPEAVAVPAQDQAPLADKPVRVRAEAEESVEEE